ncbi:MAG: aminopeptidase P family protein, partial [Nannocystaceae bacterium]
MATKLSSQPSSVHARRRAALMERLPDVGVLTFAGGMRPRNYAANPLEYRANSHFMYLTGASIPDAVLWTHAGTSELFVSLPDEDDALWHGPSLGADALRERLGVDAVRSLDTLPERLDAMGAIDHIASLPTPDPTTRQHQASLLMRRGWSPTDFENDPESVDRQLALAMVEARIIHDEGAIECLRKAAEGTAAAHLAGMRATRPGLSEHAVRGAMEGAILSAGMVTSYPPIVTTRGEILHNNLHHHVMNEGDLMLADVGAEFEGWAGDVTRTWPVSGTFTPTQRTIMDLVLASQLKAIDMVRPGVRYRDIHLEAARVLTQGLVDEGILNGEVDNLVERGAHALLFPHGVGHI